MEKIYQFNEEELIAGIVANTNGWLSYDSTIGVFTYSRNKTIDKQDMLDLWIGNIHRYINGETVRRLRWVIQN